MGVRNRSILTASHPAPPAKQPIKQPWRKRNKHTALISIAKVTWFKNRSEVDSSLNSVWFSSDVFTFNPNMPVFVESMARSDLHLPTPIWNHRFRVFWRKKSSPFCLTLDGYNFLSFWSWQKIKISVVLLLRIPPFIRIPPYLVPDLKIRPKAEKKSTFYLSWNVQKWCFQPAAGEKFWGSRMNL